MIFFLTIFFLKKQKQFSSLIIRDGSLTIETQECAMLLRIFPPSRSLIISGILTTHTYVGSCIDRMRKESNRSNDIGSRTGFSFACRLLSKMVRFSYFSSF